MLANLLRILFLAVLAVASASLALLWDHSAWAALAATFCVLFFYAGVLAIQFLFLIPVNRGEILPIPSSAQLVRAWLVESIVMARVFSWWQAFRSGAIPDGISPQAGKLQERGVVFIHGFVCNRGVWTLWLEAMQRRRIRFVAVNLEPVFGSIDAYVPIVDKAVLQITQATGKPPLLVCHSMGGLAARAWLRATCDESKVHHIVTIGSPHHGTLLGKHAPRLRWAVNAEQMHFGSNWLSELARQEPATRARKFTCFYSNCDNVAMPASTGTLPGADNRLVPGVAHLAMLFDQSVVDQTMALL